MICIKLLGGLGNQMFQYALGRTLSSKFNSQLYVETSFYNNGKIAQDSTKRDLSISIFNLPIKEVPNELLDQLKPLKLRLINSVKYKMGLKGIQNPKYFIENGLAYNNAISIVEDNCYLNGYWQSYKYFQDAESLIKSDFKFPELIDEKNVSLFSSILNENSISIHIRRGDYLSKGASQTHGFCDLNYYTNAIDYCIQNIPNPSFFIFSDDMIWVKNNLNIPYPKTYVDWNFGDSSYIDMQLMAACKHNIIANSTFSWWSGWLNQNPNRIVVSPKQWYATNELNNILNDLIPQNWTKI